MAQRNVVRVAVGLLLAHGIAFAVLVGVVMPAHHRVGSGMFGVGLGLTAYVFGIRHAFDADHIAAIDNATRKLVNDGRDPRTAGLWFSLGHSTVVFALACLVAAGARFAGDITSDGGSGRLALSLTGTLVSGGFLYLIAALNLVALLGIFRAASSLRRGELDEGALEQALASRGLLVRLLAPIARTVSRPVQLYPVGLLFGLGFDTASEVALLVLAGTGAAAGLPWYAILVLPLLFACGMSLFDYLDGLLMSSAYRWTAGSPATASTTTSASLGCRSSWHS